jgi:hypothetical protein
MGVVEPPQKTLGGGLATPQGMDQPPSKLIGVAYPTPKCGRPLSHPKTLGIFRLPPLDVGVVWSPKNVCFNVDCFFKKIIIILEIFLLRAFLSLRTLTIFYSLWETLTQLFFFFKKKKSIISSLI